jgi:hypothetical protein
LHFVLEGKNCVFKLHTIDFKLKRHTVTVKYVHSSTMRINLHKESKQLINSMATREMPRVGLHPSGAGIVKEFQEASTVAELRHMFLRESAAQEVFVDLVGEYLDQIVRSNDQSQVRMQNTGIV